MINNNLDHRDPEGGKKTVKSNSADRTLRKRKDPHFPNGKGTGGRHLSSGQCGKMAEVHAEITNTKE